MKQEQIAETHREVMSMFTSQIRQSGDDLVIRIPKDEIERLDLQEGQFVEVQLMPAESRPLLAADLQEALDRSWEWLRPGLHYLKGR